MTVLLSGKDMAEKIGARIPGAVLEANDQAVVIKSEYLLEVADYLKNSPDMAFNQLTDITSVDYFAYFEIIYRLTSIKKNASMTFKVRCYDRDNPKIPSLIKTWRGADFMEREVFDLMGIFFTGHPNMKRIFLWEGFQGHPLQKNFTEGKCSDKS